MKPSKKKKIPPRIIRFWHRHETLPQVYREAKEHNTALLSGLEDLYIDDRYMESFLRKYNPFLFELYRKTRVESTRSNLARLTLLYEYGGLYMDMSIRLFQPLYSILEHDTQVALLRRDDQPRYAQHPDRAHIAAGIIAAEPRSPFIACALSIMVDSLVRGHYNHDIAFATTKKIYETYTRYLEADVKVPIRFQFLSFKTLKEKYLTHIRIPGLANSWRAHEANGIYDFEELKSLQRLYTPLPCTF